jgi:hypothetical protein
MVQVLKDDIRAAPTLPEPKQGPERLAPDRARASWPRRSMEGEQKLWVGLRGDQAAKVWLLKPESEAGD